MRSIHSVLSGVLVCLASACVTAPAIAQRMQELSLQMTG